MGALLVLGLAAVGLILMALFHRKRKRAFLSDITSFPPQHLSRYLNMDGARLHYIQMGQGPHMVLLHGIAASMFAWRLLIPLLEKHYTITVPDLLGFGLSSKDRQRRYTLDEQAEAVSQFLDQLGIKEPILVGSSMGGAIALWMARRQPQHFSKIITLAPATHPSLVKVDFSRLAPLMWPLQFLTHRFIVKRVLAHVVARRELINDETINAYLRPYLDDGASLRTLAKAVSLLRDRRLPSDLYFVRAQVLVLYGERDRLVPRRNMEELKSILPNAAFVYHPEGGHHIQEDDPQWTYRQIESFLRQTRDVIPALEASPSPHLDEVHAL